MATEKSTSSPTTRKKSTDSGDSSSGESGASTKKSTKRTPSKRASAPRAEARKKMSAGQVAGEAARQLLELTGKEPEGVTGLERTDDGWTVQVELLELRRIPSTTDVLASYEVDVDGDGELQGYKRLRRYTRGEAGER
jgi:hypothetical protein